jgi:hypothetical protein
MIGRDAQEIKDARLVGSVIVLLSCCLLLLREAQLPQLVDVTFKNRIRKPLKIERECNTPLYRLY